MSPEPSTVCQRALWCRPWEQRQGVKTSSLLKFWRASTRPMFGDRKCQTPLRPLKVATASFNLDGGTIGADLQNHGGFGSLK